MKLSSEIGRKQFQFTAWKKETVQFFHQNYILCNVLLLLKETKTCKNMTGNSIMLLSILDFAFAFNSCAFG